MVFNSFYAKYKFDTKEQFEEKRDAFYGEDKEAVHHHIVPKGFGVISEAVYDEEGEVVTEAVLDEEYLVEVVWRDIEVSEAGKGLHPHGWKMHYVTPTEPKHSDLWGQSYDSSVMES